MRDTIGSSVVWRFALLGASVVNLIAEWPQVWTVWHTREFDAVSPGMFWAFLYIQICFSVNGWLQKDRFIQLSLGGSGLATISILFRVYSIRFGWL